MSHNAPTVIERLIIAGGRDYELTPADYFRLVSLGDVREVVSGGATGADACGEAWANSRCIPIHREPVEPWEWDRYGRRAGPMRNARMAAYATAVVLFPGGRGTSSMYREARRAGLVIFDWRRPIA